MKQAQAQAEGLKAQAKDGKILPGNKPKYGAPKEKALLKRRKLNEIRSWLLPKCGSKKESNQDPWSREATAGTTQGHLYPVLGTKPVNALSMTDVDAALLPLVKEKE